MKIVHLVNSGGWTMCGLRSTGRTPLKATYKAEHVTCRTCASQAPRGLPVWPARIRGKSWCRSCGMTEGHWPGCEGP